MTDTTLTLTRAIAASPEKVWRCWTDPAILPQWFGPDGFTCRTKTIDLREGGQWHFDMIGPDGTIWPNRHRFTRHDPPSRIEFLMDGDDDATPAMRVTVDIAPEGIGTRLTQVIHFPDAQAVKTALAYGADKLGAQTHAKLARLAETL